jgi:hypothetical protein
VPKPPADLEPIERVGRYSSSCRSHRPAWLRGTQAKNSLLQKKVVMLDAEVE